MEYTLIRSNRKTIAIQITKDAKIEVRAPHQVSVAFVEKFLKEKENWIHKKIELMNTIVRERAAFKKQMGDTLLLKGQEVRIIKKEGQQIGFDGTCFFMPPKIDFEDAKPILIKVYQFLAKDYIKKRVSYFSNRMNVYPKAVKINSAKTRWGSCSGKDSINFSWLLIMVATDEIDYVVVHELCHIKEHNHSKKFWGEVEKVLPDYKEREERLKEIQKKIAIQSWV